MFHDITDEAQWLAMRRPNVNASEMGALYGVGYSEFPSAWSLWADKAGKLPHDGDALDEVDRIWLGKRLQPVIAEFVSRRTGWDLIDIRKYATADGHRIGATVDYMVREHEDGPGIIECKARDWSQFFSNYTDKKPAERDVLQLAAQFACVPEASWGCVAVLAGGVELYIYRFRRDQVASLIDDIKAKVADFWRMVDAGDEPPIALGELPGWLRVHDEVATEGLHLGDDKTFDELVVTYQASKDIASREQKTADAAKAKIVQRLAKAPSATTNRFIVEATYSQIAESTRTVKAHTRVGLKVLDAADAS